MLCYSKRWFKGLLGGGMDFFDWLKQLPDEITAIDLADCEEPAQEILSTDTVAEPGGGIAPPYLRKAHHLLVMYVDNVVTAQKKENYALAKLFALRVDTLHALLRNWCVSEFENIPNGSEVFFRTGWIVVWDFATNVVMDNPIKGPVVSDQPTHDLIVEIPVRDVETGVPEKIVH